MLSKHRRRHNVFSSREYNGFRQCKDHAFQLIQNFGCLNEADHARCMFLPQREPSHNYEVQRIETALRQGHWPSCGW